MPVTLDSDDWNLESYLITKVETTPDRKDPVQGQFDPDVLSSLLKK